MASKDKIEELLNQCNEDTKDLNLDTQTHELTKELQNEKIVQFTDYSIDDLKYVDFAENFDLMELNSNEELDLTKPETNAARIEQSSTIDLDQDIIDKSKQILQTNVDDINMAKGKEAQDLAQSLDDHKFQDEYDQKFSKAPVIIDFDNVTMRYNKVDKLIEGLNLQIKEGEFVYLVGVSGSGKSTLSRLIYRDVKNVGGTVWVDGMNTTTLKNKDLHKLRKKIGIIFQDFKLLPDLTIYNNVKYTLDVIGYPREKKHEQILKTLKRVGILDQKDKYPNELSGGQQQRAAIARAIVNDPKIIVADEPTGNLDPKNAEIIMHILERINRSGTTVIMATHDVKIVNKYKHRTVKISGGSILSESTQGGYIYE